MLKKLKKFLVLILILPCVFLFGCGKKESNVPPGGTNPPTEQLPPSNPTPEDPVTPEDPIETEYRLNLDFNLPGDRFDGLIKNYSVNAEIGDTFILPEIADTKLAQYFDYWYFTEDETEAKIDGLDFVHNSKDEVTVFVKWKDGFETYLKDEYCTEGVAFSEIDEATVAVSGYSGQSKVVSIPSTHNGLTVTMLNEEAFKGQSTLSEVIVNSSVTIGNHCFDGCSVQKINFELVKNIGDYAFANSQIESFVASSGLENLGAYAFDGAGKLTEVDLSNCALESILTHSFSGCESLETVSFPRVVTIESYAFSGCASLENIDELYSLSSLKEIDERAFENCTSLKSIKLSPETTELKISVFDGCSGVEVVELSRLPRKVSSDTFKTFYGNLLNLKTINLTDNYIQEIPSRYFSGLVTLENFKTNPNLTSIGVGAFDDCINLKNLDFEENSIDLEEFDVSVFENTKWFSQSSELFVLDGTLVFVPEQYDPGENGVLNLLNETFTVIGKNAFYYNNNVKKVQFSSKITKILQNAFKNCEFLEEVNFADESELSSIGENAFMYSSLLKINLSNCGSLSEIADQAFFGCENLTELELPSSLEVIGSKAFALSGISAFSISNNTNFETDENGILYKKLDDENLSLLAYPSERADEILILPENVTALSSYSFFNIFSLKYIYVCGGVNLKIEDSAFVGKTPIIVSDGATVTSSESDNILPYNLLDETYYEVSEADGEISITISEDGKAYFESLENLNFLIKYDGRTFIFRVDEDLFEVIGSTFEEITDLLTTD